MEGWVVIDFSAKYSNKELGESETLLD